MLLNQGSRSAPVVLAETFEGHWHQLREITAHSTMVPSNDDVVAISNLLDQMTMLLEMELAAEEEQAQQSSDKLQAPGHPLSSDTRLQHSDSSGPSSLSWTPCLDMLLSENVLAHILAVSRMPVSPEHQDVMRFQLLKVYEALLSGSSERARSLLGNHSFLKPFIDLLSQFGECSSEAPSRPGCMSGTKTGSEDGRREILLVDEHVSAQTETRLVSLLNQLCSRLMEKENAQLLEVFFDASSGDGCQFPVFSILVGFLHRGGAVGQLARDALLLCISLSKKREKVGRHIANHSDFCPLLATGLCGLYSSLPRILPFNDPNWHRLSNDDVGKLPELESFLSTLLFCDAVLQVAHASVRQYLLGLIYMGFLVPVLGPALSQTQEEELICSTAYVDLFLRRISEPSLLAAFLQFLFTDPCDELTVVDVLVERIGLQSRLCTVTLSLFDTLVGLNCEDVMLWLTFRHLIPMTFLLPSHMDTIRQPDLHGRGAERLLSLVPICCIEASTSNGNRGRSVSTAPPPNFISLSNRGTVIPSSPPINGNTSAANTSSTGSLSLPTFLTGKGRHDEASESPNLSNDGVALMASAGTDYHNYLSDASKAVRHRYEATHCWVYRYDGFHPPSHSVALHATGSSTTRKDALRVGGVDEKSDVASCDDVEVTSSSGGPISLTEEEDRDFWKLMASPPSIAAADCNIGESGKVDQDRDEAVGSNDPCEDALVLSKEQLLRGEADSEKSYTLGRFLDLLFEKVELMPTNSFSTNLLLTGILSQLAAYPQPLLRSVLIHPDIVLQPSVKGLFTAIASLRQKLDTIMPTLPGSEEAIHLSRKFLSERISPQSKRRDSNVSLMSTISHIGQEARATRNSISAAFSSMFRRKSTLPSELSAKVMSDLARNSPSSDRVQRQHVGSEARQYGLTAVILEEWLHELAAIAHEHSVLQREQALKVSLAAESNSKAMQLSKTDNSSKNEETRGAVADASVKSKS